MVQTMIEVTLNYEQEVLAHKMAFKRSVLLGTTATHQQYVCRNLNYHQFIAQQAESVGAEIAVAKAFGYTDFTPSCMTFKNQADVGDSLEVKWIKDSINPLILTDGDRSSDIAILVSGRSPVYQLLGYLSVSEGCQEKFRKSNGKYWIPQSNLYPMDEFLRSTYASASFTGLPYLQEEA